MVSFIDRKIPYDSAHSKNNQFVSCVTWAGEKEYPNTFIMGIITDRENQKTKMPCTSDNIREILCRKQGNIRSG